MINLLNKINLPVIEKRKLFSFNQFGVRNSLKVKAD